MKTEERRITSEPLTLEERGEGKMPLIKGYAVVFGRKSVNLGGFVEIIERGAMEGCDMSDVIGCMDHEECDILGRTANGTLAWQVDEAGVMVTYDPPNTSVGRDAVELVKRGDVRGQSFAFRAKEDEWTDGEDGGVIRTIKKFDVIRHFSPVVRPAYPDTDVALRSLNQLQEQRQALPAAIDKPDASGLELAQKRLTLYCLS